ncbi:MAG: cytochrome c [Rhodospirillales bacterium]|nr:cytochrome c [Rhodospirillales bacterium]
MNRTFDFRLYRPLLLITGLVLVVALPTAAVVGDAAAGKTKAKACVTCHGLDGISRMPDAPNLSGQIPEYLALQLRAYKSGERRHPVMNVIAKPLSDEDIDDLATWYSEIEVTVTPPQ